MKFSLLRPLLVTLEDGGFNSFEVLPALVPGGAQLLLMLMM